MAWYSEWFNDEYLRLYGYRDQSEAHAQTQFLAPFLEATSPHPSILDIACGPGRHLLEFLQRNYDACGLDLSLPLLESAQIKLSERGFHSSVVRGDMRSLPFPDTSFDVLTNFFTSFGYFEEDDEYPTLLSEWRRVLRPQGALIIDYLNAPHVLHTLVPESHKILGDDEVSIRREYDTRKKRLLKTIRLRNRLTGNERIYYENLKLFTPEELIALLAKCGFQTNSRFGDFSGAVLNENSERCLIIAQQTDTVHG